MTLIHKFATDITELVSFPLADITSQRATHHVCVKTPITWWLRSARLSKYLCCQVLDTWQYTKYYKIVQRGQPMPKFIT